MCVDYCNRTCFRCYIRASLSFYSKRYGLPGDYAKIEYLFHQANEDVVIIGSSVAINSFMPDIMMVVWEFLFLMGGVMLRT